VSRDILLNDLPLPLKDPKHILVCILMGLLGLAIYRYAETRELWLSLSLLPCHGLPFPFVLLLYRNSGNRSFLTGRRGRVREGALGNRAQNSEDLWIRCGPGSEANFLRA
jgi:hypothetical protein